MPDESQRLPCGFQSLRKDLLGAESFADMGFSMNTGKPRDVSRQLVRECGTRQVAGSMRRQLDRGTSQLPAPAFSALAMPQPGLRTRRLHLAAYGYYQNHSG